jgi:hypothetical protein
MKAVDLIPPEVVLRRAINDRVRVWVKRLTVTALIAVCLYGWLHLFMAGRSAELRKLENRYGMLEERLQRAGTILGERDRLASNYEAVAIIGRGYKATEIVRSLDGALPHDCYIKVFQMQRSPVVEEQSNDGTQKTSISSRLRVHGVAPGHREVGQIMQYLIRSSLFVDVSLVWTRDASGSEGEPRIEFEIECTLADEVRPPQESEGSFLQAERP